LSAKIAQLKEWYEEHERRLATFSLLFGFVFDSLTLTRIDALQDNLWLFGNLVVIGVCIILLNRQENDGIQDKEVSKHFWLYNLLQFGFGNILGGFFVLYFRSGTLAVSWPFLLILLVAMVANELFQKRYARLVLQISFLYLTIYAFLIFIVPIALHRIGAWIFLASGLVSLLAVWLFLIALHQFSRERFRESRVSIVRSVAAIFAVMNILYFTNLIPPIPLSLKDAGIYHNVEKLPSGRYSVLEEEEKGIMSFFDFRKDIHLVSGNTLFAYSAIYSPSDLDTQIVHEWQHYDEKQGEWLTSTTIPLRLSGGRVEGFRTYSSKSSLAPGPWRVNVSTPRGQLLGRINFEIVSVNSYPAIKAVVKD